MVPQNKSEFNPIQDRLGRGGGGKGTPFQFSPVAFTNAGISP